MIEVQSRPRRAGKTSEQAAEFSLNVMRLVRKSSKQDGCGVTVTQGAGWTTATVDPAIPPGRIHYVRLDD
jgi:hypothetical protein